MLEFGPILAWYRFPAAEEFVVVFYVFSFNDALNVLYRWKIWTAGRPIQHLDPSTVKPCCCNSCSKWFCNVLLKCTSSGGGICCFKTFIYRSAFTVPSRTCKLHIPYAFMHPHTIRDAGFLTERWWYAVSISAGPRFELATFRLWIWLSTRPWLPRMDGWMNGWINWWMDGLRDREIGRQADRQTNRKTDVEEVCPTFPNKGLNCQDKAGYVCLLRLD